MCNMYTADFSEAQKTVDFSGKSNILILQSGMSPGTKNERRTDTMAAGLGIFGAAYLAGMVWMTVKGMDD